MTKKKTVLITGASQGTGQSIAFRFAADGWNVVGLSKDNPAQIQETIDGIKAAGGEAIACEVDVRNTSELTAIVEEAMSRFGGIDVLVNNTSAPIFTDTLKTSPEQFDLILSTSFRAAFFLSQACFPFLKESKKSSYHQYCPPSSGWDGVVQRLLSVFHR